MNHNHSLCECSSAELFRDPRELLTAVDWIELWNFVIKE